MPKYKTKELKVHAMQNNYGPYELDGWVIDKASSVSKNDFEVHLTDGPKFGMNPALFNLLFEEDKGEPEEEDEKEEELEMVFTALEGHVKGLTYVVEVTRRDHLSTEIALYKCVKPNRELVPIIARVFKDGQDIKYYIGKARRLLNNVLAEFKQL